MEMEDVSVEAGGEEIGVNDDSTAGDQSGSSADGENYVPKEKVSEIVSSRVNEVKNKYSKYEKLVNKLERNTGMSTEAIEAYLDNYEQNQGQPTQQQPTQQTGDGSMDTDSLKQTALAAGNVAMDTKRQVEEHMLMQDDMYSDYEDHKSDIREYADRYSVPLKQAYWAVRGPEKVQKVQEQTEQRVLQNAKNRQGLGAEGDAAAKAAKKYDLSGDEMQFLKELQEAGMDMSPEEYSRLKNIQGLDDYLEE